MMVKIRKAKLKDVDELLGLWYKFMDEHREMGIKWKEDRIPEMKDNAGDLVTIYLKKAIRSPNNYLLLIEDEGEIMGFMLSSIQKNIPIFKEEKIGYVDTIYIKRHFRGRGLSSEMLDRTKEWFKKKGISEVTIRVMCCNQHAHAIYENWGFKDIHTELRLLLD